MMVDGRSSMIHGPSPDLIDRAEQLEMFDEPEAAAKPRDFSWVPSAVVLILGGVAVLGLVWWMATPAPETLATLEHMTMTQMPPLPAPIEPETPGRYMGTSTCRECHPGENAAFRRSGHARTLRPAASDPIARWLDGRTIEDPEQRDVTWSYHLRDGVLSVERRGHGKTESLPIDFRFGAGNVGFTFVTVQQSGPDAPPVGIEHRLSYLAVGQKLDVTPGQQGEGHTELGTKIAPFGRLLDDARLLHCFDCHITTPSKRSRGWLDTATMIPDVTCERCHGPGGEHVEAARRGSDESKLQMPLGLENNSPSAQITACGHCHRSPEGVDLSSLQPDDLQIVRFQPIALARSRCFQEGKSWLSCTSCHDPHARVSRNHAAYEAVCLRCHQPAGEAKTLCRVSPDSNCLECHMPRRAVTSEFLFTDHWIRPPSQDQKTGSGH
jgi:hypothetical protein